MSLLTRGAYHARCATSDIDLRAAQALRWKAFRAAREAGAGLDAGLDADDFDDVCEHVIIEEQKSGRLVCCFRMLPLRNGSEIGRTYSARWYELSSLEDFEGPMLELGRFCVDPEFRDPDVIRVAWAAMTAYVDANGVELLFGCSSFQGAEAEAHMDALALLKERHIAPKRWLPRVKAPKIFPFARHLRLRKPDLKVAMSRMPPLLRTYLLMGGWVSDHAVVDHDLDTLHVFTGIEISRVPPNRARLLRGA